MSKRPSIAIVGAGIGGLTAAATLRRQGIEVNIYEQAVQFARVGAGIQVAANPMKVLRDLGLEDRLRRVAFQHKDKASRDYDTGELRYAYDMSMVEEHYGAPHLLMHRADLHEALLSVLPPEIIHLNRSYVGFEQDSEGVTLLFSDGERVRADALVAADGIHSISREILFGKEELHYTGRVAYRSTFPSTLLGDMRLSDGTTKWWGPDRHIVIYYITANRDTVYFTTSVPEAEPSRESWSRKGDLAKLREAFSAFHPDVRHVLDACPETYVWPLYNREPQEKWGQGKVYLLGDACHPMTPYMAQGAATAIEDAAILARCMAGVDTSGLEEAFRRYEATRLPRASRIQSLSNKNVRDWMRTNVENFDAEMSVEAEPGWVFGYDAITAPLSAPDRVTA